MHYVTVIDGKEREVEITEVGPDKYVIVLDGKKLAVDGVFLSETSLSLLLENKSYVVELSPLSGERGQAFVRGEVLDVEVLDLRRMRLRRAHEISAAHEGPLTIASPMPGKVVAVLVKEGDEVEQGQGLIVVEAMKMENELKAPRAGVVRQLTAQEGQPIDAGKTLCVVE
jgi:biotin carboxyl carrier protein